MSEQQQQEDKPYTDASPVALGRHCALVFSGMVEGGMSRKEALEALKVYIVSLSQPTKQDKDG